jgi:hypothetical protein
MSKNGVFHLPNFIIAGAPKAGTSSVHTWLADHPDALGSDPKETYYFVDPGTHMHQPNRHISNGLDGYREFFEAPDWKAPRVVFESTPSYLYSQTALDHLPNLETTPKFLFIVREPAAQIFSLYSYFKNNWKWIPSSMTFADYVKAAREGASDFRGNELASNALRYAAYVDYLSRWRNRVGTERMRVELFDDLVSDPKSFIQRLVEWLGLNPSYYETYSFPRENETYDVKLAWLQSINVSIRGALPKGQAYRRLRSLYRALNTSKPKGPTLRDDEVIQSLRCEYASANQRLAREWGLDLSTWKRGDRK